MSTRAQVLAEIAAQFPDNSTRAITPARLRQVLADVANSYNNSTDDGTPAQAQLAASTDAAAKVAAHDKSASAHDGLGAIGEWLELATDSFRLPLISDSTANAPTEWFGLLAGKIAAAFPAWSVDVYYWNATTDGYDARTVVQVGTAGQRIATLDGVNQYLSLAGASFAGPSSDFTAEFHGTLTDWTPAVPQTLVSKYGSAGQRSFRIYIDTAGRPVLETSADGTTLINHVSTAAVAFADGTDGWVKVAFDADNGAAGHAVTFSTSTDGAIWTQLGNVVTVAGTTSIFASTADWKIGVRGTASEPLAGVVRECRVFDEVGRLLISPALDQWTPVNGAALSGAPVLTMLCGAESGAGWVVWNDAARLKRATFGDTGTPFAIVSIGHNETSAVGATEVARLDAGLTLLRAALPIAGIWYLAQNRRVSPADYIVQHERRRIELRTWCRKNDVAFVDLGLVVTGINPADGIHPDSAGSEQWAAYIAGLAL